MPKLASSRFWSVETQMYFWTYALTFLPSGLNQAWHHLRVTALAADCKLDTRCQSEEKGLLRPARGGLESLRDWHLASWPPPACLPALPAPLPLPRPSQDSPIRRSFTSIYPPTVPTPDHRPSITWYGSLQAGRRSSLHETFSPKNLSGRYTEVPDHKTREGYFLHAEGTFHALLTILCFALQF